MVFSIKKPNSGLLVVDYSQSLPFNTKTVLDIGTGYYALIANAVKKLGAHRVVGVDINTDAIHHAATLTDIILLVSDVFSSIPNEKFDYIISNPPQMPYFGGEKSIYDHAGPLGMDVITRILEGAPTFLTDDGVVILLLFDFLVPACEKLWTALKYQKIDEKKYERLIRHGGETEKNLLNIKKLFPNFLPRQKDADMVHDIYIVSLKYAPNK